MRLTAPPSFVYDVFTMKKRIPALAIAAIILSLLVLPLFSLPGVIVQETGEAIGCYRLIFGNNGTEAGKLMNGYFIVSFVSLMIGILTGIVFLIIALVKPHKKAELAMEILSTILLIVSGALFLVSELFLKKVFEPYAAEAGAGFILGGSCALLAGVLMLGEALWKTKARNAVKGGASGMLIGVATIIPGVSGGTIAVLLGIYKELVAAISGFFKHFKKAFLFLLPFALGAMAAILILWFPFNLLFKNAMLAILGLFAGLIIGGLPSLFDNVKGEKVTFPHIAVAVISFIVAVMIGVSSILIFKFANTNVVEDMFLHFKWYLYPIIILIGIIGSIALIVPGISGSMVLLVLGFYKPILGLIDNFRSGVNIGETIAVLILFAVGVLAGFFLFAKVMNYLLGKHRVGTFCSIIGFIIGSLVAIFLNADMFEYFEGGIKVWEWSVAPVLFAGGAIISYLLIRLMNKKKAAAKE